MFDSEFGYLFLATKARDSHTASHSSSQPQLKASIFFQCVPGGLAQNTASQRSKTFLSTQNLRKGKEQVKQLTTSLPAVGSDPAAFLPLPTTPGQHFHLSPCSRSTDTGSAQSMPNAIQ